MSRAVLSASAWIFQAPPYSATPHGWWGVAAEISVTDHDGVPVDGLTKPMWGVHLSTAIGTETKAVEPAHDDWTVEELSESAGFYSVVVRPLQAAIVGRESPPTAFAVSVHRPLVNEPPLVQTELRGQVVVPLTFAWPEYVDQLLP